MKKKIMLLGSTGMLGHQVFYELEATGKFKITDVSYRNKLRPETTILDLHNKPDLEALIRKEGPNYIINCVGVLIKGANENPANAIYLNAYLPHFLAKIADDINGKLVHVSTDCVFSGDKGRYKEKDEKDGKDIYSKTKALGEVEHSSHLTLRTSIVGPELKTVGEGLFHWFIQQERETNGFTKAIWSGVTTMELAKVIIHAIEQDLQGLYHVTNNEPISKFELLSLFNKHSGKKITINRIDGKHIDKSFIDTRKSLNHIIPSYDQMVLEMLEFIKNHPNLYKNYQLS